MPQEFQTSFIPKKPITEEKTLAPRRVSPFAFIAAILFFLALAGSVSLYFYKALLNKRISAMDTELKRIESQFDESFVADVSRLDRRILASKEILSGHLPVSPFFLLLEDITIKSVRFNKFQFSVGEEKTYEVKMSGQATGYRAIALQASLFGGQASIVNPIFSNFVLDDKGSVSFDLSFNLDSKFLSYQ